MKTNSNSNSNSNSHITIAQALAVLGQSGNFRIQHRLLLHDVFIQVASDTPVLRGVVIDCETTNKNHHAGWVRQLGLILFEYTADGQVVRVLDRYWGHEDVNAPLPPVDPNLCGRHYQYFDEQRVAAMLQEVSLVIAHNAAFDRPFVEDRFPIFRALAWGCSYQDVDWRQAGISCGKLEHLATRFGFFYDAHRADQDCLALLEILSRPLPHHSHTVLKAVLDQVPIPRVRVWANNARNSSRCLSLHGYKWGPNSKCSYAIIPAAQLTDELVWLQQHVYQYQGGAPTITIESLPPQVRFADRRYQSHSRTQYLRDLLQEANHGQAC